MVTHEQLMSNMKGMTVGAEDNDMNLSNQVLASFLPLAHIFGYVVNIYMFISKSGPYGCCALFDISTFFF